MGYKQEDKSKQYKEVIEGMAGVGDEPVTVPARGGVEYCRKEKMMVPRLSASWHVIVYCWWREGESDMMEMKEVIGS